MADDNQIAVRISGEISAYQAALKQIVSDTEEASRKIHASFSGATQKNETATKTSAQNIRTEARRLADDFEGVGERLKGAWEKADRQTEVLTSHILGIRTALADL